MKYTLFTYTKVSKFLVPIIMIFILVSCSSKRISIPSTPEEIAAIDKIIAEELPNYQSLQLFPGTSRLMSSASGTGAPHGRWVTIYVNNIAFEGVNSGDSELPDGSLIIKDAFSEDKNLRATILMKKVNREWYYGAPNISNPIRRRYGNASSESVSACATCHAKAEKDYLHVWK